MKCDGRPAGKTMPKTRKCDKRPVQFPDISRKVPIKFGVFFSSPKTGKVTECPARLYRTLSLRVRHNSSCFYRTLSWESGRRVPYAQSLFPFWKEKKTTTFDPFRKILPDAQLLFPFLGFCSRFRSRFNWIWHFCTRRPVQFRIFEVNSLPGIRQIFLSYRTSGTILHFRSEFVTVNKAYFLPRMARFLPYVRHVLGGSKKRPKIGVQNTTFSGTLWMTAKKCSKTVLFFYKLMQKCPF